MATVTVNTKADGGLFITLQFDSREGKDVDPEDKVLLDAVKAHINGNKSVVSTLPTTSH